MGRHLPLACFTALCLALACTDRGSTTAPDSSKEAPRRELAADSAQKKTQAPKSQNKGLSRPDDRRAGQRLPEGPRWVIAPGKGFTKLQFGATVMEIERRMGAPCETRTPERCLYARRGIELGLHDETLRRIMVFSRGHPVEAPAPSGEKHFGAFRGVLPPSIVLGAPREKVQKEYAAPAHVRELAPGEANDLSIVHEHPGLALGFAKSPAGALILERIEVFPISD